MKVTATKAIDSSNARDYRDRKPKRPRVYVWPTNETVLDNLQNRRSRPVAQYREAALIGLEKLGVRVGKSDLRWSQKAGCSCGCSPGFVMYNVPKSAVDYHVDVDMAAERLEARSDDR